MALSLLVWALALCAASPCPAQKTFRISYSPGAEIHAQARERVKAVYKRIGLNVEFVPMPHKRSIRSAAEGLVDGETGRIKGLEKRFPSLRRVKVKLIKLTGAAYVSEDSPITHYDRGLLDSIRVATINGVQWSLHELGGRPADMVAEYKQLLGMLVEGRVDMILGSTLSVETILRGKTLRNRHIRKLEPLVYCAPLYHYVNEKNAYLIPQLEKALKELWAEGRWGEEEPCPGSDAN